MTEAPGSSTALCTAHMAQESCLWPEQMTLFWMQPQASFALRLLAERFRRTPARIRSISRSKVAGPLQSPNGSTQSCQNPWSMEKVVFGGQFSSANVFFGFPEVAAVDAVVLCYLAGPLSGAILC